jgi:hypothetical protein
VADTSTADEAPSRIKARLAALSAFAESQGLTGQAVFDGLRRLCSDLQTEVPPSLVPCYTSIFLTFWFITACRNF